MRQENAASPPGDGRGVSFVIVWRINISQFWVVAMYQPKVPITNAAEVKAILGPDLPTQIGKVIDHIDAYCKAWIERCPFIVISSINAAGAMDTSPKGDPPGFVRVLDEHTLAIPDRLGNHRGDTFLNVLENPTVGIVFIVPKRREVVRVSGAASLSPGRPSCALSRRVGAQVRREHSESDAR